MNTAQVNPAKYPRLLSRMPRICAVSAVSAALGMTWLAGTANAASAATPAPHAAAQTTGVTPAPAHGHRAPEAQRGGGDYGDDDCEGLIVLLCN
ncbi:hypothetical protein GCM10010260_78130 [Streptomyces filipinensis]|uniref:Uncharacterized protein n=1 Tax=Streptomyces filipinensis TaxID=66887 RepID=A0A918IJ70_9ACTN|nr:hypothetical protein [Streptomyces filipinensis]GGV26096.1 hypothetical protein GCM10010260_78130 [Streptomyces filipinensis]